MANKPVFGYWSVRGLGQPIRLLLAYLEVDYEEKRYCEATRKEEWITDKQKLDADFPNDGTNTVTESRAILKYLCRTRKPEMLGKTLQAQTTIDTVDNFMYDIYYSGLVPVLYQYTDELHNQYKQMTPIKLGYLNTFLKNMQWVAGDDISYVDFFVYELLLVFQRFEANSLDNFPSLQAFVARVENLPAIKKYIESPSFIKSPMMSPIRAIIKM